MRERIAQQLSRMLAEDPSNTALQRQQILLGGAHISTVHSFCSELVRENFYKLNISHDFRIADEGEMSILPLGCLPALFCTGSLRLLPFAGAGFPGIDAGRRKALHCVYRSVPV